MPVPVSRPISLEEGGGAPGTSGPAPQRLCSRATGRQGARGLTVYSSFLSHCAARAARLAQASPLCALLALSLAGCVVHTYHPMQGMGSPVVVDAGAPNFQDLNLTVTCLEGDYLSRQETNVLCQRVSKLFENQGAVVKTVGARGPFGGLEESTADDGRARTDLSMELRSRRVHQARYPLSWVTHIASFTVLPYLTEQTFSQEVTIRDADGFLLAQSSLQARIVRRAGAGPWVSHKLMDWLVREEEDRLTGDAFDRSFSEDMYGQLSQLVFNAKLRWQTLRPLVVEEAPTAFEEAATGGVEGGVEGSVEGDVPGGAP